MQKIDEVIEGHGGWPGAFQVAAADTSVQTAATGKVIRFKPRIVDPHPGRAFHHLCCPLVPLKAAAGVFSDPQHIDDDNFEWVEVASKHRLGPGMFVGQVVGKSMEAVIPDGSYCLFASHRPLRVHVRASRCWCNFATAPIPRPVSGTPSSVKRARKLGTATPGATKRSF